MIYHLYKILITHFVGLFVFFLLRIVHIAERQRSSFSRIYGYGVASIFFIHLVINIGMTIGLVPVIGIPLPFFSYGGSSMVAMGILMGLLLNVTRRRTSGNINSLMCGT